MVLPTPLGPIIIKTSGLDTGILDGMRDISRYANTLIGLVRYQTWFLFCLYGLCVALSSLSSTDNVGALLRTHGVKLAATAIVLALWYAHGTGINDYNDYEIDLVNVKKAKDRPLVRGLVTKNQLRYIYWLCASLSMLLSYLISTELAIITVIFLLLNIAYSTKPLILSRRGGVAPLLLPLGYVLYPALAVQQALSINGSKASFILTSLALYLLFGSRIILKDYRDVKGDKKEGKLTFLLKHGNTAVTKISSASLVIGCLILTVVIGYRPLSIGILMFLMMLSLRSLKMLSTQSMWSRQKPLIVAFGRLSSGITAVLLISILAEVGLLTQRQYVIQAIIMTLLFTWSVTEIVKNNQSTVFSKQT